MNITGTKRVRPHDVDQSWDTVLAELDEPAGSADSSDSSDSVPSLTRMSKEDCEFVEELVGPADHDDLDQEDLDRVIERLNERKIQEYRPSYDGEIYDFRIVCDILDRCPSIISVWTNASFGRNEANVLGEMLKKKSCKLQSLTIEVDDGFEEEYNRHIWQGLAENTSLKEVRLLLYKDSADEESQLNSAEWIAPICQALVKNETIQKLDLCIPWLDDASMHKLGESVGRNRSLQILSVEGGATNAHNGLITGMARSSSHIGLKTLILENTHVDRGERFASNLSRFVQRAGALQTLQVNWFCLCAEPMAGILEDGLRENTSLRSLEPSSNPPAPDDFRIADGLQQLLDARGATAPHAPFGTHFF